VYRPKRSDNNIKTLTTWDRMNEKSLIKKGFKKIRTIRIILQFAFFS